MTTVFLLIDAEDEDPVVLGVFSTVEKARRVQVRSYSYTRITERVLDPEHFDPEEFDMSMSEDEVVDAVSAFASTMAMEIRTVLKPPS